MNNLISSLNQGNVIIIQTDTVYGLAVLSQFQESVYKLKKRDKSKPLINMIYDISQISDFGINLNDYQKNICQKYWPGATTLIINDVSFRIPASNELICFLKEINKPILTTSANISGMPTPRNIDDVKKQFPDLQVFTSADKISHTPSKIYEVLENKIIQIR